MSFAPGLVVVDLDALGRNYARVRQAAGGAECGAVVKGDAYGLGAEAVARRLWAAGCERFFVATAAEGLTLRGALPDAVIYVFEGVPSGLEPDFVDHRLTPVLNTLEQLARWRGTSRPAALHLDTGMTRLGLAARDAALLAAEPGLLEGVEVDCLMTHLACADEPDHALNAEQLARFERLAERLPAARRSIANSAGAFLGVRFAADLVRPGIALYGGNPFAARPSPVEPVATLKARILQLRDVERGASIGYGATYAVEAPARVAVLGIGYADGYPRHLGNRGIASVAGVEVPVVGRVSMDLVCVDVSAIDRGQVEVGEYAELFGASISIDDVAAAAGTISYELLTRLGPRLKRHYLGATGT